ncbi:TetR/AcrR family transcriptional regulator [Sphingobium sp. AN641]|uniref:TetR/AcrR family transcriptional regulator n=1 Tax=Sphingobium sp. AN641 TaxID=3133443 RepID=UPI0030C470B1
MSLPVDRHSRRAEVAEAAYHIVAEQGLDMLTVRAVAKAMGCSTAVVSHYFAGKQDLLLAVHRFASECAFMRWASVEAAGGDLCACLKEVLPTDTEMRRYWRVYFSFWSTVGTDPGLGAIHSGMLARSLDNIRRLMNKDPRLAKLETPALDSLVRQVLALQTGIATQAAISEDYWPADQQIADLESGFAKLLAGA